MNCEYCNKYFVDTIPELGSLDFHKIIKHAQEIETRANKKRRYEQT